MHCLNSAAALLAASHAPRLLHVLVVILSQLVPLAQDLQYLAPALVACKIGGSDAALPQAALGCSKMRVALCCSVVLQAGQSAPAVR